MSQEMQLPEAETLKALDEGEYYRALGVSENHARIDIETASESLSARHPDLAARLSGITQVVAVPDKREIFTICCDFRDQVLRDLEAKYGDAAARLEGCKRQVWSGIQRLMRCDFEKADIKIGPVAAESIAANGRGWIITETLNRILRQLKPGVEQRERGVFDGIVKDRTCERCKTTRKVACSHCRGQGKIVDDEILDDGPPMLVDDPEEAQIDVFGANCGNCGGTGTVPCDCYDTYRFEFRPDTPAGAVVVGRGLRTGRTTLAILDYPVAGKRPTELLKQLHLRYNMSQRLKCDMDTSFEEVEDVYTFLMWCGAIPLGLLGGMVGLLGGGVCGEWVAGGFTGAVASVPMSLYVSVCIWRQRAERTIGRRRNLLETLAVLLAVVAGAMTMGTLLASWTVGCCVLVSFVLILGGLGAVSWRLIK